MKSLFIGLSLLISSTILAQTGSKNFIDQNYIEVIGKAEKEIAPDLIYLKILINEKDVKGKTLEEIENSMFDELNQIGIDVSKDLLIKDIASNFQYYWILKRDIFLSKEYQLLVHKASTAGKVLQQLQKLGIANVSIARIDNSKIKDFRKEVRVNAMKSARDNALSMAEAINQNIGRAIYIHENEKNTNMTGMLQGKAAGIVVRGYSTSAFYGSRAPKPDIDFEKIKLEYSALVRFELK